MFEELRKASHCQELFPQRHIESKQEGIYRWEMGMGERRDECWGGAVGEELLGRSCRG